MDTHGMHVAGSGERASWRRPLENGTGVADGTSASQKSGTGVVGAGVVELGSDVGAGVSAGAAGDRVTLLMTHSAVGDGDEGAYVGQGREGAAVGVTVGGAVSGARVGARQGSGAEQFC
jgi:hypothetical protein